MVLLSKKFYQRDPAIVAKEILGNYLVRKIGKRKLVGKIVETEAYYGMRDPASRAYKGEITKISKWMWAEAGTILVYMVHANWLFNIITGKKGNPQAVLIRAVEPANFSTNTSGPGRMTRAMKINGNYCGSNVYSKNSEIKIVEGKNEKFKTGRSHRIGVSKDMKRKLRFFIKENKFVSK